MINNIDSIKQAAIIIDVIQDYVKLKKVAGDYIGLCPFHKEKTPSFKVSKAKDIYKCFGCGKSGDSIDFLMEHENINYIQAIKLLAVKYNIPLDETLNYTPYEKPVPRLEKPLSDTVQYFQKRGISNNTLLSLGVTESIEWMPAAGKEVKAICFNYIRERELINIKFRAKDKDFKLSKNAELIFYNIDAIADNNEAVIVEGEIDCLTLHECGITNVVSVPNGTPPSGQIQLKYLDNCWQEFENKTKIIIFVDNDDPGKHLKEELARRLGKDRCWMVEYPEGCKDANEVLLKHGKGMIQSMIEQAKRWPIEGILTVEDVYEEVKEYYLNGMPEGCKAGIGEFDELLSFSGGQLTVITGSPGSGKSEFIDYISTSIARKHNWKFSVCSFENPTSIHVTKLMEKFIGLSFNFRKDPSHRMSEDEFKEAIYLTDLYFSFLNIAQVDVTIEGILSKLTEAVLKMGIKGVIIDPWNYIEHKIPPGYSETQYISEALTLIREFAIRTNTHVFLVAHPKKLVRDKGSNEYPVATMYDISGSAHFFNKTDNGISIHRSSKENIVDVYVQKVRFSWLGKLGYCSYSYDTFTRKYIEL